MRRFGMPSFIAIGRGVGVCRLREFQELGILNVLPCLDDADAQFGELAHHVLDLLGLLLKRFMNWKPIRLSVTSV
jgi:hypothetical protein